MFRVKSAEAPDKQVKVGIIVVREYENYGDSNLMPFIERLSALGCTSEHFVLKRVAKLHDTVITLQYFAQYTDVDSVIILAPEERVMAAPVLMEAIVRLELQWNMYITMGGAERADDIQAMYTMFLEMEQSAPEQNFDLSIS